MTTIRGMIVEMVLAGKSVDEIEKELPKKVDLKVIKTPIRSWVSRVKSDLKNKEKKGLTQEPPKAAEPVKEPVKVPVKVEPKKVKKAKAEPKDAMKKHTKEIKESKRACKGGMGSVRVICVKCKTLVNLHTTRPEIYTDEVRAKYVCVLCK